MKRNLSLMRVFGVLAIAAMITTACAPAATAVPTAVPQPTTAPATQAPAATEAPTTAAATAVPTVAPTLPPQPTATTAAPSKPKVVTIAFQQEPDVVQGLFSSMSYAAWVSQLVVTGLAKWDDKNNLIPDLAADIPTAANGGVSKDGLTITWKLKPNLKWSDGQPLTSADVLFTWQALVDKANAPYSRAGYDQISGVDTPDATTAVLHFSTLYPGWQTLFTSGPNNQGQLLPQHILKGKTALEKDPEIHQPTAASGVWMIKEWVAGDHMTLVPNPSWYGAKPKLDGINIKFVPDSTTALAALKTGDVDMVPDFSESDIATISPLEPNVHLRVDSGPSFEHYFFNLGVTTAPVGKGKSDIAGPCPFQDVNVRKAIMLGIDRQTLVDTLLSGKVQVPATLWPNSTWENTSLKPYPFDPAQAMQLLDAAGYKPGADGIRTGMCGGKQVKLSFNFETTDKQLRKDMAVAVKDMLSKIGVEFKPTNIPSGTFFGSYTAGADMTTGKFDMAGFTTGFYPDPYTDNFLCSSVMSKENQGGDNDYHICDPKLDAMFAQVNASADPAARKQALDAIQQYQYDNVLFIPIYTRANIYGYQDRFVFPPTSVIAGWGWNTELWDVK